MSIRTIAHRYASTLVDIATDQNLLNEVKSDIVGLQEALKVNEFDELIKSPVVSKSKKKEIFAQIFKGKMSATTLNFCNLLLDKNREAALPEICNTFLDIYREKNKISSIVVTSAVPMDSGSLEALKKKLIDSKAVYPTIEVEEKIDPSLIGGFIVELGDKILDASLSTKLAKMKRNMTSFN